jgi:hypothetical protein
MQRHQNLCNQNVVRPIRAFDSKAIQQVQNVQGADTGVIFIDESKDMSLVTALRSVRNSDL